MTRTIADVTGRRITVVGGTRGIGRAVCERLVELGASVVLTGRTRAAAGQAAAEINAKFATAGATGVAFDASLDLESAAERLYATGLPDALIYNAGISPVYSRAEKIPLTTWNQVLAVNLSGPFACATAYARKLLAAQSGGAIVFVSSIAGLKGTSRLSAYGASKAGLIGLTRHLALEWASAGIRVNAVAPGWVRTDLTNSLHDHPQIGEQLLKTVPLGWIAAAEDIADTIVFLASGSANYVTGAIYAVDGGATAG